MRIKYILIILTSSISCAINAQNNRQLLSVEFGYGVNSYSMRNLNQFYIDSFAVLPHVNHVHDYIKSGQQFRLGINYKLIGLFDFGIYGSYQYGNSISRQVIYESGVFPTKEHRGRFQLRAEAISAGINSSWYLSHLFKFQEKESTVNRVHLGIEASGGIGFAKAITEMLCKTYPIASYHKSFANRSFQGQIGLKAEYDFTKSPLFTTLGIRLGYQYFKTKTLKDKLGKEWVVQGQYAGRYPISLDFSGFYFATYLKLGR